MSRGGQVWKKGNRAKSIMFGKKFIAFINGALVQLGSTVGLPKTSIFSNTSVNVTDNSVVDSTSYFDKRFPIATIDRTEIFTNLYNSEELYNDQLPTSDTNNLDKTPVRIICPSRNYDKIGNPICFTGYQNPYIVKNYGGGGLSRSGFVSYLGKRIFTNASGLVCDVRVKNNIIYIVSGKTGKNGRITLEVIHVNKAKRDGTVAPSIVSDIELVNTGTVTIDSIDYPLPNISGPSYILDAKIHPECTEVSILINKEQNNDSIASSSRYAHLLDIVLPVYIDTENGISSSSFVVTDPPEFTTYLNEECSINTTTSKTFSSNTANITTASGFYGEVQDYGTAITCTPKEYIDENNYGTLTNDIQVTYNINSYTVVVLTGTEQTVPVYNGGGLHIADIVFTPYQAYISQDFTTPEYPLSISTYTTGSVTYGYSTVTYSLYGQDIVYGSLDLVIPIRRMLLTDTKNVVGEWVEERSIKSSNRKIGYSYIDDISNVNYGSRNWVYYGIKPPINKETIKYKDTINIHLYEFFGSPYVDSPKYQTQIEELTDYMDSKGSESSVIGSIVKAGELIPKIYCGPTFSESVCLGRSEWGYEYKNTESFGTVDEIKFKVVNNDENYILAIVPYSIRQYRIAPDIDVEYAGYPIPNPINEVLESENGFSFSYSISFYPNENYGIYSKDNGFSYVYRVVDAPLSEYLEVHKKSERKEYDVFTTYITEDGTDRLLFRKVVVLADWAAYIPFPGFLGRSLFSSQGIPYSGSVVDSTNTVVDSFKPWFDNPPSAIKYQIQPGVFLIGGFGWLSNPSVGDFGNFIFIEDTNGNRIATVDTLITPQGILGINSGGWNSNLILGFSY